jgi:hypothetical protein
MAHQAEDISKIEDIGERLDALLDALETSSNEVARIGSSLDTPLAELQADASGTSPKPPTASPSPDPEPQAFQAPALEPDQETEPEPVMDSAPQPESEGTDAEDTQIDDGLLIEPEFVRQAEASQAIDNAPVGPLDLEEELDQELAALLESGVFEDPLAEMGVDESAEAIELPEEVEPVATAPQPPQDRQPKLPTDEAELIGELDEQLAALADAQLADAEESHTSEADAPDPTELSEPEAESESEAEPTKPEPAPQVVTRPATPAPRPKAGWRAHADALRAHAGPLAIRVMQSSRSAAIAASTRASAPLRDKPQLRQIVGWVGLVQAFLAACVWAYLALWHNPPAPAAQTPQPALEVAEQR